MKADNLDPLRAAYMRLNGVMLQFLAAKRPKPTQQYKVITGTLNALANRLESHMKRWPS